MDTVLKPSARGLGWPRLKGVLFPQDPLEPLRSHKLRVGLVLSSQAFGVSMWGIWLAMPGLGVLGLGGLEISN